MRNALLVAALAAALPAPLAAPMTAWAGTLSVKDAVVRAVPTGVPNTAAYLTIVNAGAKPDKLISVSCDCARSVEIHLSHVMNGMAMMMPSGPVDVPAGGQVSLSPGGRHLMVMGLKSPLVDGAVQDMTLKFRDAGAVQVGFTAQVRIVAPAAGH